jgi:hypothetical protein
MKTEGFDFILSLSKDLLGFVGAFLAGARFEIVKARVSSRERPYAS